MKQYHELLKAIKEKGTLKSAAREGMPGTISLFGYQMRFNLQEGFLLVTTKKVSFKNIVVELLWFLKGDTNIKYLIDNGCNIWNEDAYNYYLKFLEKKYNAYLLQNPDAKFNPMSFEVFVQEIKTNDKVSENEWLLHGSGYRLGDCGKQYGWLWRNWETVPKLVSKPNQSQQVDQLKELIEGLQKNPISRRHIITAWNPTTLDDMALNACHAFVQFNCRPLTYGERWDRYVYENGGPDPKVNVKQSEFEEYDRQRPQYYLDCQMYQRSADVVLGVPYNIASYALLTEILCKIYNMVPGDYIHTFGDVHIYENHLPAVEEQLQRECRELPTLRIETGQWTDRVSFLSDIDNGIIKIEDFKLDNYNPYPKLENETELFTGLKK